MGMIKSFFSDKGRVGVFIVCLMLLSIGLVSSILNETYADSAADYTCPIGGNGPYNTSAYGYYCHMESVEVASSSYSVGTSLKAGAQTNKEETACYKYLNEKGYTYVFHSTTGCAYSAIKKYTLTYNANGGTGAPAAETWVIGQSKKISSTVPTRAGYTFDGWIVDGSAVVAKAGGGPYKFDDFAGDGEVVLTAKWTAKNYTVTYDPNGGTGAPATETWVIGQSKKISSTVPTRAGYTFAGWMVEGQENATVKYEDGYTIFDIYAKDDYKVVLTAKWIANNYTVTYDPNGGTGAPATESWTFGESRKVSSTVPTRAGYTFVGWIVEGQENVVIKYESGTYNLDIHAKDDSKVVLTAKWTENPKYTVIYDANGGTGAPTTETWTFGVVKKISSTVPTRAGYTFAGWMVEGQENATVKYEDGYTTFDIYAKDDSKVVLTAKWTSTSSGGATGGQEVDTYTVTYNSNGGTGTMSSSTYTSGVAKSLTKNAFAKTGYTFNGWNTKADGSETSYNDGQSITVTKNLTLYAQWKANTYSVKYDANGGTGTMSNSTHTYGTAKKLTTNTFVREGYVFNGWNTKADGSSIYYTDGQSVTNLSSTNGATVTLYAQWILEKEDGSDDIIYYVKYDANGGIGTMSNSEHIHEEVKNLSANTFVREGYVFNGWNTKADGTGISYTDSQAVVNLADSNGAIVTLYAQWIIEEEDDGNNNVENGSNDNNKPNDSENIEESPKTGSLPIILVSLIAVGAFITFSIYRKKVRI